MTTVKSLIYMVIRADCQTESTKTRYVPLGLDALLDLSNVSCPLGLDVACAYPDRALIRDGLGDSRNLA
jgi:hypothetical protein